MAIRTPKGGGNRPSGRQLWAAAILNTLRTWAGAVILTVILGVVLLVVAAVVADPFDASMPVFAVGLVIGGVDRACGLRLAYSRARRGRDEDVPGRSRAGQSALDNWGAAGMSTADSAAHVFVGESRRRVVVDLAALFDEVKNGSGSHIAVLVSPPGWGKTRIVHELYRCLVAGQSQPAYWPPAIVDEETGSASEIQTLDALSRARKAVYPPRVPVEVGARMDWIWWGVLCGPRLDGTLERAMWEDTTQLRAHAEALMRDPIGLGHVGGRAFDAGAALIGVLGVLGLAIAPPVGVAITVAAGAKVIADNVDVLKRLRPDNHGAEGGRMVESDSPVHREDEVEQLLEGLGRLTRELPMILVVDDAHFADETLVRVIDGLVREGRGRVLVVATAWPSHLDASEDALPFPVWAQKLAAVNADRYLRFDLGELTDGDIEEVVRADLPAAEGVGRHLKKLYVNNLLAIRALLRLEDVRQSAESGKLDMEALEELPPEIEGVFKLHWDGLPRDVRRVLALAAQPNGTRYLPEVVAAACETQGIIESARKRIADGVSPYAWTKEIDRSLHTFVEPVYHEIAQGSTRELLGRKEKDALRSAIIDAALRIDTQDLSARARRELLEQHVALVKDGSASEGGDAARSAYALAETEASRYEYSRAIELTELGIAWSGKPRDDPDTLAIRYDLAGWLGNAGRVKEAALQFKELLADQLRVHGADHPDTLAIRHHLAFWLGHTGQVEEAALQFEELLAERLRVLGPDHPHTLMTRHNLAALLGEAGRPEEASRQFEELLADRLRVLGPDHPDTLATRHQFASYLGEAGRPKEASRQFEDLVAEHGRVLGPDHPDTLATRHQFASFLGEAGRADEASREFAELLSDQLRVLPSDHPNTLTTRSSLAHWLGEAGRPEEASRQLEELLPDRLRVLGPDHPDMLTTRHSLAFWLGHAGRAEEAADQFEQLLADMRRVLGPEHPNTLTTRGNLALWLGEAGRAEEAMRQLKELLADRLRVLGPGHPDTLGTRHNLASLLGQAGHAEEAIRQLEELLAHRLRVLGADHPDTLKTRHNLALLLAREGRAEEAARTLEEVLADRLRVLGRDHPDTLATRHDLVALLGETGRPEEAALQLNEVLAHVLRVHGPDHPDTLATRSNLARWLGEARRVEEATRQFEELLADLLRVHGPDHPDTLITRHNLASFLGEAGRAEDAMRQFEELLADLRVLDPDHPITLATRHQFASLLGRAGRMEEATDQVEKLLSDQLRVFGPDHPNTLATRRNLAHWLGEAERTEEAALQLDELLAGQLRLLGPDHPDTLATRSYLAVLVDDAEREK